MQNQSDLSRAQEELAGIDRRIAALEQRRAKLRTFVELGRALFGEPATLLSPSASTPPAASFGALSEVHARNTERESSLKARILDLSRNAITQHGPLRTVQLVKLIEDTGLEITGKDKNVTVSVILSRSSEFVSDRHTGWSLAEKNPHDAPTSAGSSTA